MYNTTLEDKPQSKGEYSYLHGPAHCGGGLWEYTVRAAGLRGIYYIPIDLQTPAGGNALIHQRGSLMKCLSSCCFHSNMVYVNHGWYAQTYLVRGWGREYGLNMMACVSMFNEI